MRCFIFGAGVRTRPNILPEKGDLVIAADGGYEYCVEAGVKPDLFIGDLDSLESAPEGVEKLILPVVKDVTDSYAAAEKGLKEGASEFYVYGCAGGRPDHTFANLSTLAALSEKGKKAFMFFEGHAATAITGKKAVFQSDMKGGLSVFAWGGDAENVNINGAKYVLSNGRLSPSFPLGVSNSFVGESAEISVGKGTLLIFFSENGGVLPEIY